MDLVVQFAAQNICSRVCEYFEQRHTLRVFPEHFTAAAAVEVGPHGAHEGPCLVLFEDVQIQPEEFNDWFQSSFVERPAVRVFWMQRSIPAAASREALVAAIAAAPVPAGATAIRVDVFPKSLELEIGQEVLDAGFPLPMHPVDYSHLLFVVRLGPDCWRYSYMPQQRCWRHSSIKPKRFKQSVARAIHKIAEAVAVLGLDHLPTGSYADSSDMLLPGAAAAAAAAGAAAGAAAAAAASQQAQVSSNPCQQPAGQGAGTAAAVVPAAVQSPVRWAIDIGACPGGWSTYLAECCGFRVIAVDPADLHPDVTAHPAISHVKARAEDAASQIEQLLAGEQAELLVCDMNDHPDRTRNLISPAIRHLKPGGWLILTLKFFGRGREKQGTAAQLDGFFQGQFEPGTGLWLLANTTCERTYAARKAARREGDDGVSA